MRVSDEVKFRFLGTNLTFTGFLEVRGLRRTSGASQ